MPSDTAFVRRTKSVGPCCLRFEAVTLVEKNVNTDSKTRRISFGALRTAVVCAAVAVASTAAPAAEPTETAMATSDFVNTIGVNTHFNYATPYRKNAGALAALLGDSGIRHIRDGAMPFTDKSYLAALGMLAARGEKIDVVTDDRLKLDWIISQSQMFPAGMIDAYENPNELDLFRGGDVYINALRTFTPALYRAVKADPRTHALAVIGPSLTTGRAYAAVGDLSASMDYGNLHNYVNGRPPGTDGWGTTHYGSIRAMMSAAKPVTGPKPIMTTEAGWGTSDKAAEVTEGVQLKYLQRFFFEQALHGIKRSYIYEFMDEGSSYKTYGLVRGDLSPKPSYAGLRNLIALFEDSGAPRRDDVHVSVDAPTTVHHMLFEKSDGRRYLAIWNEVPSIALRAGGAEREEHVAPVTAHISLDGVHADVYGFDDTGAETHSTLTARGDSYTFAVTDAVSILVWHAGDR